MGSRKFNDPVPTTASGLQFVMDIDSLTDKVDQMALRLIELEKHFAALVTPGVVPLTVKELSKKYPTYSEGSLRWLLFHRQANGLARAVIQGRGGRIKIDEREFLAWVSEGREKAPTPTPEIRREREGARRSKPAVRRRTSRS